MPSRPRLPTRPPPPSRPCTYTPALPRLRASHLRAYAAAQEVSGLRVSRVTRIHNRFLRARFEAKLEQLADVSDASHKRALEYLFFGRAPCAPLQHTPAHAR
jgi:hypothetical protein